MENSSSTGASGVKYSQLPDPLGDRFCKTLESPANKPMDLATLFPPAGKPRT